MKEDICSIPVNEVLEQKDGCPICRMYQTLEESALDFVLGAAMMEPDIRKQTNQLGFCRDHFAMMTKRKNRLSLALILDSHLQEVEKSVFEQKGLFERDLSKAAGRADQKHQNCYVCQRIDRYMEQLIETFFRLWKKEREFRENVAAQPILCLPHYSLLISRGKTLLDKKNYPEFCSVATKVTRSGIRQLEEDVAGFCRMFDYHNNGEDFGRTKDSIERTIQFLTGNRTLL